MTEKERLLYDAARCILRDECPPDRRYYQCKNHPDDTEDTACAQCWDRYLLDVVNGLKKERE